MAVGEQVSGRYEIFRHLGRGGMGDVWAALDTQLERKVALKAIRGEFRLDPASRARFLREARALSKLEHPGICRIFDYVATDAQDYLVLELIEGEPLRDRIRQHGALERAEALRIAEQVADALAAAHAEGLIHRDLKPHNVMLTPSGEAKILDFGLARSVEGDAPLPERAVDEKPVAAFDGDASEETLTSADTQATPTSGGSVTRVGSAVGTPLYMSPEQARGEPVGPATDLFSFGLLLQEMCTGERAYEGVLTEELKGAIAAGRPKPVHGLDRALTELIERLESPAASRRPTAEDALERIRWIRAAPQRRLRRVAGAVLVLVAVAAGVKYTLDVSRERAAAEFRRAQSDAHIEFMVGDLYEKLEPVGRLDILEEVGDKALAYFDTLSEDERTDEDRARLGRTLTRIGHVHLAQGELEKAREVFARSVEIHAALVALDPNNGTWQMGLSGAHFGLGNVAWVEDDLDVAVQHFETYLEVSKRLLEIDPDDPKYQLESGYALTNMAGIHDALGEVERAAEELQAAAQLKRGLLENDPGNAKVRKSLAGNLAWLADLAKQRDDLQSALDYASEALELRRALAEDERDAEAQDLLSISLYQIGELFEKAERLDDAEAAYREDMAISLRLTQLDPDNLEWERGLLASWNRVGWFYYRQRRYEQAETLLRLSLDRLASRIGDPDLAAEWRVDFFRARNYYATLQNTLGRRPAALRTLTTGPRAEDPAQRLSDLLLTARIHADDDNRSAARRAVRSAERWIADHPDLERKPELEELRRAIDSN